MPRGLMPDQGRGVDGNSGGSGDSSLPAGGEAGSGVDGGTPASTGIVSTQQEADGVKRVLDAAALTYVAAAAASLLQLIDLVLRQRR